MRAIKELPASVLVSPWILEAIRRRRRKRPGMDLMILFPLPEID
jgi:hypothetical protein